MHRTKQHILNTSIQLFNTKGLVNVRLQQIADACHISVGNLAYHYYSKKAILIAIDQKLEGEITPVISIDPNFPSLIDFDNHLSSYYYIIKQYSFYFLDVLELDRAYPNLQTKRKDYISQMMLQLKKWMLLNVDKGILVPEHQEKQYDYLVLTIWIIITFWLTQQKVRASSDENEGVFKKVIWNQLVSLFTEAGLMEYEALILPQLKYYDD
jgi:AcrR family transcriptional regulator